MDIKRIIILLLPLLLLSLDANSQSYFPKIKSKEQFKTIASKPLTNKYGKIIAIKVVYDLETQKLYFINPKQYKYHHRFCKDILRFNKGLELFNDQNYTQHKARKYLLGNLNYNESLNLYFLDLSPIDLMNEVQIHKLYKAIKANSFIHNKFSFLINTSRLSKHQNQIKTLVPIISPSEIYKNLNYQGISNYKGEGNLRFIQNLELETETIQPNDIIVIKQIPLTLPDVAGIIVTEFQTPLSHLTILGRNRRIPIAAIKTAFSDSNLLKLENKPVRFSVTNQTFRIKKITTLNQKQKKKKIIKLHANLKVDTLFDFTNLLNSHYKCIGNKAANFGVLTQLAIKNNFKVPENAFAIPFYYYHKHILKSKTNNLISELILNKDLYKKTGILEKKLQEIQEQILKTSVDSNLINLVENKIKQQSRFTKFRFRSSTNAEDLKGFSGAGLYDSKTGIIGHKSKTIEKAIKKVWASLWNIQAFKERERFNIKHSEVFMGILVHRSFPNEAVNGVAITKNLYRKKGNGFIVNAQLGNDNVVNPKPGVINDQFICYPTKTEFIYANTIDIISESNINHNQLVMTEKEIIHLANMLDIIKRKFYFKSVTTKAFLDFGLDIEFKLDGKSRTLYIKQIRPYND